CALVIATARLRWPRDRRKQWAQFRKAPTPLQPPRPAVANDRLGQTSRCIELTSRSQATDRPDETTRNGDLALRLFWQRRGIETSIAAIRLSRSRCPPRPNTSAGRTHVPLPPRRDFPGPRTPSSAAYQSKHAPQSVPGRVQRLHGTIANRDDRYRRRPDDVF